jgi:hypothetical protein
MRERFTIYDGSRRGFDIYPALNPGCQDLYDHFLEEIQRKYKDAVHPLTSETHQSSSMILIISSAALASSTSPISVAPAEFTFKVTGDAFAGCVRVAVKQVC